MREKLTLFLVVVAAVGLLAASCATPVPPAGGAQKVTVEKAVTRAPQAASPTESAAPAAASGAERVRWLVWATNDYEEWAIQTLIQRFEAQPIAEQAPVDVDAVVVR